ncbi:MAG TPA: GIY-YIG nuclease family protein [Rudaea sp.]|nr:GIY-YIG nuclease family protein [Rudaea sp.]
MRDDALLLGSSSRRLSTAELVKPGSSSPVKQPCVYILASGWDGTLYVGVTSNLIKRVWEHKNDLIEGFTKTYRVHNLVWFEQHETMESAILRVKAIKEWKRAWKVELIEESNQSWRDLYPELL